MADIIIVGGGISGMLSAWYLAREGMQVTLLERGEPGRESSWAGGGIISPLYPWRYPEPVTRLARWSQQHYAELVDALRQQSGCDPEYLNSGLLMLGLGEEEFQRAGQWAEEQGYRLEFPHQSQVAQLQPGLNLPDGRAVWMPQVAQVRNPRLLQALRDALEGLGVTVLGQHPVSRLLLDDGQIRGVEVGTQAFHTERVVLCAGAWTDQLLPQADAGIRPVRGQMLLYQASPELLQRIVLTDDHYFIPRKDGKVLVGSTMEEVGFDKSTTPDALAQLQQCTAELIPALAACPLIHHWAGLRPARADGIPCISAHPEIKGLFINAGQYRNGVVTGPASARLLADLVLGMSSGIEREGFEIKK